MLTCPARGTLLPEQVSAELLRHLLQHARQQLDDDISHVVSNAAAVP